MKATSGGVAFVIVKARSLIQCLGFEDSLSDDLSGAWLKFSKNVTTTKDNEKNRPGYFRGPEDT